MITYPKFCDKNYIRLLKCAICRGEIKHNTYVYQSSFNLQLICDSCHESFSENDIDLITNMFIAYGGYFGQYKHEEFSISKILKDLIEEIKAGTNRNLKEMNIKMLHKALLHGITPKRFINTLKFLLKY
ncbi:MAG: hypothetical protein ACTSQJ_19575 [Promethearchaeota archaeon]